jgi:hypothetical protein
MAQIQILHILIIFSSFFSLFGSFCDVVEVMIIHKKI